MFVRLFSRPCRARLVYYAPQCGTVPHKNATTGGLSIGADDILHGWVILCSERRDRCERCPRFHALREVAAAWQTGKKSKHLTIRKLKSDRTDGDWEEAEVRDLHAQCMGGLNAVTAEIPDGADLESYALSVKCTPSIDDAKHSADHTKDQSSDGSNEREILHDAIQANAKLTDDGERAKAIQIARAA